MGCAPVRVKIYIYFTRLRAYEKPKMKTSYYKFTIPHARLATMQHLANSEKKWWVGGRGSPTKDKQQRLRSDSGGQRGKLSPFEKFGNFDILKCPLLASEDEFSSYFIQLFIWKTLIFQAVNYLFGPFTLLFGTSNLEIRIPHPKIHRNRFHYLFLWALGRWASLLDETFCINSTPWCVTAFYFTQRG